MLKIRSISPEKRKIRLVLRTKLPLYERTVITMQKTVKKYFTQKELEKHINSRLLRERKKYGELTAFKEMADMLTEKGIIDADSYAEAAAKIMLMIDEHTAGNREVKQAAPKFFGVTADTAAETASDANCEIAENTDLAGKRASDLGKKSNPGGLHTDSVFGVGKNADNRESADDDLPFQSINPGEYEAESDGMTDNGDGCVREEENGAYDVLSEICTSLLEIIDNAKKRREREKNGEDCFEDGIKSIRRNFCSTGFSKGRNREVQSFSDELTPQQRDIARRAGISYREYSELLREIPEAKKRKQYI